MSRSIADKWRTEDVTLVAVTTPAAQSKDQQKQFQVSRETVWTN